MVTFQSLRMWSITSGFRGSPALHSSRSMGGRSPSLSRIIILHTVGGAQNVATEALRTQSTVRCAEKRDCSRTKIVAPAFQGAKKLLQACFAQPGELTFWCTSPSRMPTQYIVERWPTGELACVWRTSFGLAVVPEVKYSNKGSLARVS